MHCYAGLFSSTSRLMIACQVMKRTPHTTATPSPINESEQQAIDISLSRALRSFVFCFVLFCFVFSFVLCFSDSIQQLLNSIWSDPVSFYQTPWWCLLRKKDTWNKQEKKNHWHEWQEIGGKIGLVWQEMFRFLFFSFSSHYLLWVLAGWKMMW